MDLRKEFLTRLLSTAKSGYYSPVGFHCETWPYVAMLRNTVLRLDRGDAQAWTDLMEVREGDKTLAEFMRTYAERDWPVLDLEGLASMQAFLAQVGRGDWADWAEMIEQARVRSQAPTTWDDLSHVVGMACFSESLENLTQAAEGTLDGIRASDLDFLAELLRNDAPVNDEKPIRDRKSKSRIMYIERKAGQLTGEARIGQVTFSKSGKSIYYHGRRFKTLMGRGVCKSNYYDVENREEYWISGPRRDGQDRLYGERQPIEIDDDAREEYWTVIRKRPDRVERSVV